MIGACACVLQLIAVPFVRAQPQTFRLVDGTAQFSAEYTFGSFTGRTAAMRGTVTGADLVSAQGSVTVLLDSLDTGNATRDRHMREALETADHPTARFVTDSIRPLTPAVADSARLFGTFTVRGVSKQVTARARVFAQPAPDAQATAWQLETSFPVTLADHGITKGISRFLGTVRVGQVVTVSISARFAADSSPRSGMPDR